MTSPADTTAVALYAEAPLRSFSTEVFARAGMSAGDAELLAAHLVWAELRAASALGVRRIPQFLARMRAGGTPPVSEATVETHGAVHVIDARDAWAHVVAIRAMDLCISTARTLGVSLAVVRNTTTPGALGYYADRAVEAGMLGIALTNTPPLMPAWGGAERVIGNQAFAIGAPAGEHPALLADMATSAMSYAGIHQYEARGERLPDGVAVTAAGRPTTDPIEALAGMLLPMGGHRGYALAVMWEVLTGVLAGGDRFAGDVTMPDDHARPQGVSMFLLAVNIAAVLPVDAFRGRADTLIDRLLSSRPAAGSEGVTVPGRPEHERAVTRRSEGIPLGSEVVAVLRAAGDQLGVPFPRPMSAPSPTSEG